MYFTPDGACLLQNDQNVMWYLNCHLNGVLFTHGSMAIKETRRSEQFYLCLLCQQVETYGEKLVFTVTTYS